MISRCRAYLDASGKNTNDGPISCVAGYMAHVDDWIAIEEQWQEALNDYGLDYFHQREIPNLLSNDHQHDLEKRLHAIISDSNLSSVGGALVNSHWEQEDWGDMQTRRLGSTPEQCLDMALHAIFSFSRDKFPGQKINIMSDKDEKKAMLEGVYYAVESEYSEQVSSSMTIGSLKEFIGLQCADFGAWRLRRSWIDIGYNESQDPWGAMPQGSGGGSLSFWSLNPGTVLKRALRIMTDDGEAK